MPSYMVRKVNSVQSCGIIVILRLQRYEKMLMFERFKRRTFEFNLDEESIDQASEWVATNLKEACSDSTERSDRIRMRLMFEEALLNMAEHFGKDQKATVHIERRQGHFRLRLVAEGPRFNPTRAEKESEQYDVSTMLFSSVDMHFQYAYSMGSNVLRISLPKRSWNPVAKTLIAIAVGALIGLLGSWLIPDAIEEAFTSAVLKPISDMWVRLLQTISGPIIFLTALTAAMSTKRIADYGGSRFLTFARYFSISALVTILAMVCAWPFFSQDVGLTEANRYVVSNMLDRVLQIVPVNLIEPFLTANAPQLLLIAIATGYLLASLESSTKELTTIIQQLNHLGLAAANFICSLVPFFVGLLLCLKMWTHETGLLTTIWVPLVVSIVFSAITAFCAILVSSIRSRINPLVLFKKLKGPFIDALKRGVLDFSTIDDLADSCERSLGIDAEFARAALPQGLFLYMPTSAIGICVFILFAAWTQHLPIDQAWLVATAAISVVLSVATPPVTGANLLSFVIAFSYLGISDSVILDVMVFDIVFGVFCIAFDQLMLQIETIYQAKRMGFLDVETLRAPQ